MDGPLPAEYHCEDENAGAGARVIREILRTPVFLEIVRTGMAVREPESARAAARILLGEDPALTLSLAGGVPGMVNYLVEFLLELGKEMNNYPAPLLKSFSGKLYSDIDMDRVRELPVVYLELARRAGPGTAGPGTAINSLAASINRAARRNPLFLQEVFRGTDLPGVLMAAVATVRSAVLCLAFSAARWLQGAGRWRKTGIPGTAAAGRPVLHGGMAEAKAGGDAGETG